VRRSGLKSDRRAIPVFFPDLTGFTALSDRVDPLDVRALQKELYKELRAASTRCFLQPPRSCASFA